MRKGDEFLEPLGQPFQALYGGRLLGQRRLRIGKRPKLPVQKGLELLKFYVFIGFGGEQIGDQFVLLLQLLML